MVWIIVQFSLVENDGLFLGACYLISIAIVIAAIKGNTHDALVQFRFVDIDGCFLGASYSISIAIVIAAIKGSTHDIPMGAPFCNNINGS